MGDYFYGTDLISPYNYDYVWQSRYFAREDVDHYLYEVVKKNPEEYVIHAYDCNNKFVKEIAPDFWKVAYGSFVFFNAHAYRVGWFV